jgi:hypothetical protein
MDNTTNLDQQLDQLIESLKSSSSSQAEPSQPDTLAALNLPAERLKALLEETACADCTQALWSLVTTAELRKLSRPGWPVAYCQKMYQHSYIPDQLHTQACGFREPTGRPAPTIQEPGQAQE